jgi:hypothetical protein
MTMLHATPVAFIPSDTTRARLWRRLLRIDITQREGSAAPAIEWLHAASAIIWGRN